MKYQELNPCVYKEECQNSIDFLSEISREQHEKLTQIRKLLYEYLGVPSLEELYKLDIPYKYTIYETIQLIEKLNGVLHEESKY